MKHLKNTLPNGDKIERFGDLNSAAALNAQTPEFTTVQFNLTGTVKGSFGQLQKFALSGHSNHAPKYSLAGVTQVIANQMPADYQGIQHGNNAEEFNYKAHQDNSLECSGFNEENTGLETTNGYSQGYTSTGIKQVMFDFTFDPISNFFKCTIGGFLNTDEWAHVYRNQEKFDIKRTKGVEAAGGFACNRIDPTKDIMMPGIAHYEIQKGETSTITKTSYGYKIACDIEQRTPEGITTSIHFTALIGVPPYEAIIKPVEE